MEETKEQKTDSPAVEEPKEPSTSEASENMVVDEGAPSGSKDLSKTLPEEAFNNFIQGKRHMLVQDYNFAVQSLAVACELYCKHFGELALECGEVYFLYGKSLIRLSQQQSGVLGDAINKAAPACNDDDEGESSEEDEKENESESGEDKEKEGEKNDTATEDNDCESDEKEPSESTDSPQAIVVDTETKETEKGSEPNETAEISINNETVNEEGNPEQEQEPEEDDLELAWNSLETAKTIFSRDSENKEAQLKVAEILQLLAEISMETDNYPAAISDLKSCLCIQRKYLEPDDRLLAHTYYEMGLAHMLQKMYDGALENFTKTLEIFHLRRDNLEKTPVPETVGGFEAADRQKEIEDIDSIITDIREKIEDTKELVRNAKNEIQEAILKKETEIQETFVKAEKPETNNKPVSNITHLLKRKKPDEEEKESETKRIKITNGDTTVSK